MIEADDSRQRYGLKPQAYGVVTLHRPANVDRIETLAVLVDQLKRAAVEIPLVFAIHPRTRKQLQTFDLLSKLEAAAYVLNKEAVILSKAKDLGVKHLVLLWKQEILRPEFTLEQMKEPQNDKLLGLLTIYGIVNSARLAITDSGGVQEETTYLNIPCLTLRDIAERPITLTLGTNQLMHAEHLLERVEAILNGDWNSGSCPKLWDGRTAARLISSLSGCVLLERSHGSEVIQQKLEALHRFIQRVDQSL